ncbi:MAG: hypothetical protein WCY05_03820 [Candidatus Omnitrophota bacterium]
MQSFVSTLFTILLIYFLITFFFRIVFVIARFLLQKSLNKRFSGASRQKGNYRGKDINFEDVIDAEFEEIKK